MFSSSAQIYPTDSKLKICNQSWMHRPWMGLQTVRHTAQLDWSNALSLYCNTKLKSAPLAATNIPWWTYPLPWPKPFTAPSSPQATWTCNKHQKPPTWSLQWISCFVVLKSMHHYFFCQPCLPKWLFTRATAFFQGLSHYPRHPYGFWTLLYTLLVLGWL